MGSNQALNPMEYQEVEYSNPNLIDNWDLGDPVNQEGFTSGDVVYKYQFDRWIANGLHVAIGNGCTTLTVTPGTSNRFMNQPFDPRLAKRIDGEQLTLSILTKDGRLASATGTLPYFPAGMIDGFSFACYKYGDDNKGITISPRSDDAAISIELIKLEHGPIQTAAVKRGGIWVRRDALPNYPLELAKCQYWLVVNKGVAGYNTKCIGYAFSSTDAYFPLPHIMRTTPLCTVSGTLYDDAGVGHPVLSATATALTGGTSLCIKSSGLTVGKFYRFSGEYTLDCNM